MLGNLAGGYYRDAAGKKGPKREGATYVPGHRAYKARCEHRPYARADQLEAATRGLLIEMAEEFGDEPEMRVGGTSEVVVQAETALESAKLRRDADLTNLDLPAEALATRLAAHDAAIAGAEEAYGEALEAAEPEVAPSTAQEIAAMSLVELAQYLRRMYDAGAVVAVAPGKGDVAERLSIREASDFA